MENKIRFTTRLDNLYKYDVDLDCIKYNSPNGWKLVSENFSSALTNQNFDERRIVIDSQSRLACYLKGGYAIELFLEITQFLGTKIQLMSNISEYEFDHRNSTQQQPDVDMYVASYVVKASRRQLLDATYVTGHSNLKAFLNHDFETSQQDALFAPFTLSLWLFLFGTAVISLLAIQTLHFAGKHIRNTHRRETIFEIKFHVLFEGISIILQKGSRKLNSGNDSLRFAAAIVSFSFFIYTIIYSGWLVAVSSVDRYSLISLSSLVTSSYDILIDKGYGNGSASEGILQKLRKEDKEIDLLLKKASKSTLKFDTFEKAIQKVQDGPVAFVTEDDSGRAALLAVIGEIPCAWGQIHVKGIRYPWSMFMRKGFKYRRRINSLLLNMDERGLTSRIRRRSIPSITSALCLNVWVEVTLSDVLSGFYPIFLGMAFAIVVLIAEKIII